MIYYLLTFFILITFFIFNKKGKNIKIKVFKDFYTEIKLKLPKKNYEAGQFVIMDFIINDEKISRAYSLSNDQEKDGYGRFIIKKVNNGVVSNFLLDNHENIKNINFTGPFGDFVINKKTNNHVFIAGGSGITPIASILNKYLEKRKENYFFLIYGNKSYEEILLDEEIFNLSKKFNNLKDVSDEFKINRGTVSNLLNGIRQKQYKNYIFRREYYKKLPKEILNQHIDIRFKEIIQFDLNGKFIKEWSSLKEIRKKYNNSNIASVLTGNRNNASGFIWKYKDNV